MYFPYLPPSRIFSVSEAIPVIGLMVSWCLISCIPTSKLKRSDILQYAVESQIQHHGLLPSTSLVTISPPSASELLISTEHILSVIAEHASTTALLLLPGIRKSALFLMGFLKIPFSICLNTD